MSEITKMRFIGFGWDNSCRSDAERIKEAAAALGYSITVEDAEKAWECYSESMAAGWMMLDEDDGDIWRNISHYFVPSEPND